MTRIQRLAAGAAACALACAASGAVHAQETTAAIRGQVTGPDGAPARGATVTVTHIPTGSAVTSLTGRDGFYATRGLRVGGPYRIEAAAPGFERAEKRLKSMGV